MDEQSLREALLASQRLGMLGGRPVDEVIAHAGAFVDALGSTTGTVVDIGSGGGVPGLIVAVARPDLHVFLVDRRATRTDHLERMVRRLGLDGRVTVACADATRWTPLAAADAVVARGFGPPGATATTAARLLRDGGILVVSEPPGSVGARWRWASDFERLTVDRGVAVLRRVPRETRPTTSLAVPRETIDQSLTLPAARDRLGPSSTSRSAPPRSKEPDG